MASDRPVLGEEPDQGTCNALHIHLVVWALADDSEDENAEQYDTQAELLMTCADMVESSNLLTWLRERPPGLTGLTCKQRQRRNQSPQLLSLYECINTGSS